VHFKGFFSESFSDLFKGGCLLDTKKFIVLVVINFFLGIGLIFSVIVAEPSESVEASEAPTEHLELN
jgi:hypothetical protein